MNFLQVINKSKEKLGKEEKEFKKLVNQVSQVQEEIDLVQQELDVVLQRYSDVVLPLVNSEKALKTSLIKALHKNLKELKFSKNQKSRIEGVLISLFDEMNFEEKIEDEELKEIYSQFAHEEEEQEMKEVMAQMEKMQMENYFRSKGYNIDLDAVDFSGDPAEMKRKIHAQLDEQEQMNREREQHFNENPSKKSKKQLEKEAKEKEARNLQEKDIKSIYRNLVKLLHPDLEQDYDEKLKKEDLMKQLTKAYEEKDIYILLQFEIQYLNKDALHITSMDRQKLKNYTHFLREQVEQLKIQLHEKVAHPRYFNIYLYVEDGWRKANANLYRHTYELAREISTLEIAIESMRKNDKKAVLKFVENHESEYLSFPFFDDFPF